MISKSGTDAAAAWRECAEQRLAAGHARFEAGMLGRAPLFEIIEGRRLPHADAKVMIDGYGRECSSDSFGSLALVEVLGWEDLSAGALGAFEFCGGLFPAKELPVLGC